MFSGTVFDNIRLGNKDIALDEVVQAARYVNAHKFIEKLLDLKGVYYKLYRYQYQLST